MHNVLCSCQFMAIIIIISAARRPLLDNLDISLTHRSPVASVGTRSSAYLVGVGRYLTLRLPRRPNGPKRFMLGCDQKVHGYTSK